MFKKGQLVRSKDTGRIYEFIRVYKSHFLSGDRDYRTCALVRRIDRRPMYATAIGLPMHVLELIGNNYQAKPKCSR